MQSTPGSTPQSRLPGGTLLTAALALGLIALVAVLLDVRVSTWAHVHPVPLSIRDALQLIRWPGHFAFTLAVALIVAWGSRHRLHGATFLVASTVAASGVAAVMKWVAGRVRPFKGAGAFEWHPFPADPLHTPNLSFPSGDATLAFATAAALALLFPRIRWPAFFVAALVGVTRVVQGAHYPSDVCVGAFIGIAITWMVWNLWPQSWPSAGTAMAAAQTFMPAMPLAALVSPERGRHGLLADEMRTQGKWLFRWRSFLPLLLIPWVVHGLATFNYPMNSHLMDVISEVLLIGVAFIGLAFRVATVGFVPKGTSGRNTKQMKAYALNTSGVYSIVRHPLYLANFLIFIAPLIHIGDWMLVAFATVAYWLYYERIMIAEEPFLLAEYGDAYVDWAQRTPAIVPSPRQWRAPSLTFSWRSALRREYTTFFLIVTLFTAVEITGDYALHRRLVLEPAWCVFFAVGLIFYLTVRILKRSTRLLEAPGR